MNCEGERIKIISKNLKIKFMKKIIYNIIIFVVIISIHGCCQDPLDPNCGGGLIQPECTWQNNSWIKYQTINLKMPNNHTFHGININNFIAFPEVFAFGINEKKSNIMITTIVSGCTGTLSKSITYTGMYDNGLLNNGFENQNIVSTISLSAHQVTLEMTSGPWQSKITGEIGTIIWETKPSSGLLAVLQPSLILDGTFKVTQSNVRQEIYIGSKFEEYELY